VELTSYSCHCFYREKDEGLKGKEKGREEREKERRTLDYKL